MDTSNDKLSLKTLLFTRAIPNYVISVPIAGHKVYGCTDCGDKFILESSYEYHVNRKSVKITYFCRVCNEAKMFFNRCNLLSHIRSHTFKTATINIIDLNIEPLPLNFYKTVSSAPRKTSMSNSKEKNQPPTNLYIHAGSSKETKTKINCIECKADLICKENEAIYQIRAKHYMKSSNNVYTCPVCLFTLPTLCALQSHMRFHMKLQPYICPECGLQLTPKLIDYPYNHSCEGFKMMRTSVRMKCPVSECYLFHPTEYKAHFQNNHFKPVYKCSVCHVSIFEEEIMDRHLKGHQIKGKARRFLQCQICPQKLLLTHEIENHLKAHTNVGYMYPCWSCGIVFKDLTALLEHHINAHDLPNYTIKKIIQSLVVDMPDDDPDNIRIFRVVKRCELCKRNFTYTCRYNQINTLPNECPYKCPYKCSSGTSEQSGSARSSSDDKQLICYICKSGISQNWEEIKKHFREKHIFHTCVDVRVVLEKINIEKYINKQKKTEKNINKNKMKKKTKQTLDKPKELKNTEESTLNSDIVCKKCGEECENKERLENHMLTHRDPCMAYQCMECGECFVVKPSFSKHLLLKHNILNVEDYISEKRCYNENALNKYQDKHADIVEPLRENQCKICRDQFDNSDDLEKHFRVHGMAFLMKSKTVSP